MIKEYQLEEEKRLEKNLAFAEKGVRFIDIKQAYIGDQVKIGKGTLIYPCVVLEGKVTIGEDCVIGQNTRIVDSTIGKGTDIQQSVILKSQIGNDTKVGPFAYIRPYSKVGDQCKVGDFVEVKNATLGNGSKSSHLTYIGDADVGENVNIGCGVVFVNYDGKNKHRTTVEDEAFIGCNTNLVSPVHIERKAYIAAGSTVTKKVPSGSLFVARAPGRVVKDWVEKRGLLDKKEK